MKKVALHTLGCKLNFSETSTIGISSRIARFGSGGRIHQFLWRRSRAVSNANGNLAVRSD
jgi:hypothetical protein